MLKAASLAILFVFASSATSDEAKMAKAHNLRGLDCLEKKEFGEAIKEFTLAMELDPDDIESLRNRGTAFYHNQQIDEAIRDLTAAILLDPGSGVAFYRRGQAYDSKSNYKAALEDYFEALRLDPSLESQPNYVEHILLNRQYKDIVREVTRNGSKLEEEAKELGEVVGVAVAAGIFLICVLIHFAKPKRRASGRN